MRPVVACGLARFGLQVVIVRRCFAAALARRIHAVSDNDTLVSEAAIAAEAFVQAALDTPAA